MSHSDQSNLLEINNLLTDEFKDMLKAYIGYDDQITQAETSLKSIKRKEPS